MKKMLFAICVLITLYFTDICALAEPATDSTGKWEYNELKNGSVSIHSYIGNDTKISIPSKIGDKNVVAIEDGAFISGTRLTQITIPSGIVDIEEGAFFGCISLENFVVSSVNPRYVSSNGVLMNKTKTKIVCMPAKRIGTYTIPKTVTYISKKAFAYSKLSQINISQQVNYIGNYAFMYCVNLREITVPSNVREINEGAFSCCYNLKNVTISEGVKSIGEYAFLCEKGTSNLEKIFIPKSVEVIGEFTFENCDKVIIIGDNSSVAMDYAEYKGIKFEKLKTDKPTVSQTVKINKVANLKQKTSYSTNTISIKWDGLSGVTGYEVYRMSNENGKYNLVATTQNTCYKNSKLKAGKTYYYKIRAYKIVKDKKIYGAYSNIVPMGTKTSKPSIKIKSYKKNIKITWKKVSGANGYEVYMSTKKSGKYKKIKTATYKQNSYTRKKLNKGKKYYFKVRTYRKVNGKKLYSAWSKVVGKAL